MKGTGMTVSDFPAGSLVRHKSDPVPMTVTGHIEGGYGMVVRVQWFNVASKLRTEAFCPAELEHVTPEYVEGFWGGVKTAKQ